MRRCITDYLVQEHQELSHLLNELQEQLRVLPLARDTVDMLDRLRTLASEISNTLHSHLEGEEQILYPALEGHVQGVSGTLERMRHEHDDGEAAEEAFMQCLEQLGDSGRNRKEVMRSGDSYIQWMRSHLMEENGRLFPLVERGLDPETQKKIRQAMEELSQETAARVVEGLSRQSEA